VKHEVVNSEDVTPLDLVFEGNKAFLPRGVGRREIDEIGCVDDHVCYGAFAPGPEEPLGPGQGDGCASPLELVFRKNLYRFAGQVLSAAEGLLHSPGYGDVGADPGHQGFPPFQAWSTRNRIRPVTPQILHPFGRKYSG